jgi:hypothetical protein
MMLYLDTETYYPYSADWPQPETIDASELRKRQRDGKAHPYAKDSRRCLPRFLTISNGDQIVTIDFQKQRVGDRARQLLATQTLCGH